jgi:hypothetical protein
MKKYLVAPFFLFAIGLMSGCVTHIKMDVTMNPPPAEKFSDFNRFELTKVMLPAPFAGQAPNERALVKVQENVNARMAGPITAWNAASHDATPIRTLVIEPTISDIKFISVGSRIMAGAIPGSSAIILRARITEKETNRVIATPEFYARANTWAGAFSFGAADNVMLVRVANRLADYLLSNYTAAVGGPTGAEPPAANK